MKKLAIITTHPIQYYAPVFRLLSEREFISIRVFYTWGEASLQKTDPGFGKVVQWDIPLLDGYPFKWVKNVSDNPGSHHFKGIINPELISDIKNFNPDTLLVFGWAYHSHLKALRYFKGKIPVLFRGDSTLHSSASILKKMLRMLFLRWVYRHVNHAFYVGKKNKAYFEACGLREKALSFAPHAVDNARFAGDRSQEVQALRTQLVIPEGDFVLLYAGKMEPVKDLFILLDAFSQLKKTGVHLLLAGNGILENELKEKSKTLTVADCIHFMPFQNQQSMPVLYQLCNVFCLPSKSETWGLAVNEAMACSKAVVVSDKVGCAPDLVKENGYIFKQGDADDLAGKLELIFEDKARLNAMGKKSAELIKNWTFTHIADAIEKQMLK